MSLFFPLFLLTFGPMNSGKSFLTDLIFFILVPQTRVLILQLYLYFLWIFIIFKTSQLTFHHRTQNTHGSPHFHLLFPRSSLTTFSERKREVHSHRHLCLCLLCTCFVSFRSRSCARGVSRCLPLLCFRDISR